MNGEDVKEHKDGVALPFPTCADCLTQDLCRDGGACAIKVGRESDLDVPKSTGRKRLCRDCADFAQDGICPNDGKPCSTSGVGGTDGR